MTAHMNGGPSGAILCTFIVNTNLLLYAYRYYHVCDNTYHNVTGLQVSENLVLTSGCVG